MAKTDWKITDTVGPEDMNQIGRDINALSADNSVTDAQIGDRTISDAAAPTGDRGKVTTLFGWLANMIKTITGKSSWRTSPRTTLENAVKRDGDTMTAHLFVQANGAHVGVKPVSDTDTGVLGIRTLNTAGTLLWGAGAQVSSGRWGVYDYLNSRWAIEILKDVGVNDFRYRGNIVYHAGNHGNTGDPHSQYLLKTGGDVSGVTVFGSNVMIGPTSGTGPSSSRTLNFQTRETSGAIVPNNFLQALGDHELYYFKKGEGNLIWTKGNHGPGSGMNADLLDGFHADQSNVANTAVVRASNRYINVDAVVGEMATSDTGAVALIMNNGSGSTSARRWSVGMITRESGTGNEGSDFAVWSYSNGGTNLHRPLTITRSNGNATFTGNVYAPRLSSTIATGASPLIITSTTMVPNLNVEMVGGAKASTSSAANSIVVQDANQEISVHAVTLGTLGRITSGSAMSPGVAGGGVLQQTGDTGNGYGFWQCSNCYYNGTTWIQIRGDSPSYAHGVTLQRGRRFYYAAAGGTNGGNITMTEVSSENHVGLTVPQLTTGVGLFGSSSNNYVRLASSAEGAFVQGTNGANTGPATLILSGRNGVANTVKTAGGSILDDASGNSTFRTVKSTVATGTAPLSVASTTMVTNLNSEMVGGSKASAAPTANTVAIRGANGTIKATTPVANDDLATKNYVDSLNNAKANLASPTFTGTPSAPTAPAGTNNTQLATTAFTMSTAKTFTRTYTGDGLKDSPNNRIDFPFRPSKIEVIVQGITTIPGGAQTTHAIATVIPNGPRIEMYGTGGASTVRALHADTLFYSNSGEIMWLYNSSIADFNQTICDRYNRNGTVYHIIAYR